MVVVNSEFSINAAIAPPAVEFHIHHVVSTFHIKNVSHEYQNIPRLLLSPINCCIKSRGTNAINISGVNPLTGHETDNKMPLEIDNGNKYFAFIGISNFQLVVKA